jgi:hypothetical protein
MEGMEPVNMLALEAYEETKVNQQLANVGYWVYPPKAFMLFLQFCAITKLDEI